MKPLISIIVPVYNSEDYLHQCLGSIISQTLTDFEVIIVDDGSTDNSYTICSDFKSRDQRIRLIKEKNRGPSFARNVALEIAQGEFIGFVDSDDWIEMDMYDCLYRGLTKNDADISICGYYTIDKQGQVKLRHCSPGETVMSTKDLIKEYIDWNLIGAAVWSKLFKKSIFNKIRFPENLKYRVDAYITPMLLGAANKGVHIGLPKYHYRIQTNSVYRKKFDETKLASVEVEKTLIKYLNENHPELADRAAHLYANSIIDLLEDIIASNTYEKYNSIFKVLSEDLRNEINSLVSRNLDQVRMKQIVDRVSRITPKK
jgi:glycosyltransferase involved in cell wall biosynthesis